MSVTSVRPVLASSEPEPEIIEFDGSKWKKCLCGCGGLLPITSKFNYLRKHKFRRSVSEVQNLGASMAGAIRSIEQEIALRKSEISKLEEAFKRLREL